MWRMSCKCRYQQTSRNERHPQQPQQYAKVHAVLAEMTADVSWPLWGIDRAGLVSDLGEVLRSLQDSKLQHCPHQVVASTHGLQAATASRTLKHSLLSRPF